MVTVAPNGTAPAESAVHGARHTDGEPANPARERVPVVRFDDQVNVIVLNAEGHDPEVAV